jgi:hypothetical protein
MVEKKKAKKPQDIVPLMLRLREALRQRLAKEAEKGAKSLNAEIVDRLEASYTKDERIEELRERLRETGQTLEKTEAQLEKDTAHFAAKGAEQQKRSEALRVELRQFREKYEDEVEMVTAQAAVIDALVGDDDAAKEAVRSVALLLAGSPGWATSPEGIQELTQAAIAAIQTAARRGIKQ